ncbi:hypothetical protein [Zooshikella ganghwensis]|uniref:Uncharacterized protein n=1 Tax=Zooshikella ganghwensis TaxID=202772 RepID=A0A4P9VQ73_9GAMM|nr:hypothetical protein [Zooshikella ganghwensis]RDH45156.1 hypothetical protein B9G39_17860 [Zooshikella ganghwensis]
MQIVYKLGTLLLLIGALSGCIYSHWQVSDPGYYPAPTAKHSSFPYEHHGYQQPKYQCHKDTFGKEACGYDCKKSAFDGWVCATNPEMNCVKDVTDVVCGYNCRKEYTDVKCDQPPPPHHRPQYRGPEYQCKSDAFGKEACGYDCKETPFDGWVCASQPNMNCVKYINEVKCGLNCRREYGDIVCDYPDK